MEGCTMTDSNTHDDGLSRRNLFLGLGAAAGAGVVLSSMPGVAGASEAGFAARPYAAPPTDALGPTSAALTYLPLDALAFFTDQDSGIEGRYSDNTSGTGSIQTPRYISVSLPLPVGSVIRQINVAYQGQPIIEILKRPMTAPQTPAQLGQTSLAAGGGPKTQTLELNGSTPALAPITIEAGSTYSLRFFLSAGGSVYGATIGYQAPTQAFVPFMGPDPRVLDTRVTGGKLLPTEERVVSLGFPGARTAVFNLAVTDTNAPGGFVAAFRADIAWPGNASINWSGAGAILSNGVICQLDANGAIKIRGGANPTHVVIDRIGFLI
jgi:hypothetical protein